MRTILSLLSLIFALHVFGQDEIKMAEAKFKTGNDPRWSNPAFDDNNWETLKASVNWDEQGYQNYDGYAWYRFHVFIPSGIKEKSYWQDSVRIFLAKIDDADETY